MIAIRIRMMSVANEEGVAVSRIAPASAGPVVTDAQMSVIRNGTTRAAPTSHAVARSPASLIVSERIARPSVTR